MKAILAMWDQPHRYGVSIGEIIKCCFAYHLAEVRSITANCSGDMYKSLQCLPKWRLSPFLLL